MSRTQLILVQSNIHARIKLLKKFNGQSGRIEQLQNQLKAVTKQINRLK